MAPAPAGESLELILQAAMRAPDHARLRPWRFLLLEGEAREKLGALYAEAAALESTDVSAAALNKLRQQPLRAPLLVVIIASITEHPKVPREEQLISAGCAAHSMLLAAQAQGFGGIWRTGANAYNAHVKTGLGLADNEEIVGFLYLGSLNGSVKSLPQMSSADFCRHWP